jgi:hypothetical protein
MSPFLHRQLGAVIGECMGAIVTGVSGPGGTFGARAR